MIQEEWYKNAANYLKAELARAGVDYEELQGKLKDIGVEESYKGLTAKINRGTFSFAFFMQCMQAMQIKKVHL